MVKRLILLTGFMALSLLPSTTFAAGADTEPQNVSQASFQARCLNATKMGFPECADSPAECKSQGVLENKKNETKLSLKTPFNCLFLQEQIGGRTGFDLYKMTTFPSGEVSYDLWYGEALGPNQYGPFQAILTYEEGKEVEGPFTLLYNYLGLVYNFMSGIIVAIVILFIILGGIRISAAGGNSEGAEGGKGMIVKALIGMVLWFTASVILYTINPTFFAF